jgi:hypothetical protein
MISPVGTYSAAIDNAFYLTLSKSVLIGPSDVNKKLEPL